MKTNITILGEVNNSKSIQFIKRLYEFTSNTSVEDTSEKPSDYKEIVLLRRGSQIYYDLIFAYDDDPNEGILFLGFFNDGVV